LKKLSKYRSEFPITEKYTYLNNAAISAPSTRVVKAVEAIYREFSRCGIDCGSAWIERITEVRELFARLIHADPDEIAFTGNTSEGLSAIAAGLKWKKGDVVLIPEPEFPANVYPWMNLERYGVQVTFIQRRDGRLDIEDLNKALQPKTRLISLSSVDFAGGFRSDLKAMGSFCKEKGILFCVDAVQSLGVIPMDVKKYGIHFLSAGGHKWLISSMGCAGLFISKDVADLLHPEIVGWKSVVDDNNFFRIDFDLKPNALRFEPGTMNVAGIYALGAAIDLLLEAGIDKIYRHVMDIIDYLVEGLKGKNIIIKTPMGQKERSGIFSFVPASDPEALIKSFQEKKIIASLRNGMIRISPHFYNNIEDIDLLLKAFH